MKKPTIAWVNFYPSSFVVCYKYGKGYKRKIKNVDGTNKKFFSYCLKNAKSNLKATNGFIVWFEFSF